MIKTLSDALAERGYATLTDVQTAVTAEGLEAADLLVSARTGSGKTVAFGLAIAPTLLGEAEVMAPAALPLALVVAPTRELALQVKRELAWLYAGAGARVASCIGGMDAREERRALERGAHIVVGTPGRLCDHLQRGTLDLSELRAVVLDEADEMLDLGFKEDLETLLAAAPEGRRTLLFSATVPPAIEALARTYQRDAVRIVTHGAADQHADIAYQVVQVARGEGENGIINLLRFHEPRNAIVFANTRAAVNHLAARLGNRGFRVVVLSGELAQEERSHALQAMRDGRAQVCIATDVAARGIDLPKLDLVIHAELPIRSDALLHRSGRTGRAGRKGISALIVPAGVGKQAERLLRFARVEAEWITAPGPEQILRRDEERLLADPLWDEAPGADEAAFAAALVARFGPEAIAAACLRLYRAERTPPEDLSPADAGPGARRARTERPAFGPSRWVALSVGRDAGAEARWLLPLVCRAGDISKQAIGAIRVQDDETFVELAEAEAGAFLAVAAQGAELEDGIRLRLLDGVPDLAAAPRREWTKPARGPRPRRDADVAGEAAAAGGGDATGEGADTSAAVTPVGTTAPDPAPAPLPVASAPAPAPRPAPTALPEVPAVRPERAAAPDRPVRPKPLGEQGERGAWAGHGARPERDRADDRPRPERERPERPWSGRDGRDEDAPRPRKPRHGKSPDDGAEAPRARFGGKPGGKFAGKPGTARPQGSGFGRPRDGADGKPEAKPYGKPYGKPSGKPYGRPEGAGPGKPGGKPFGKPAGKPWERSKPAADPSDTSQRLVRPGQPERAGAAGPRRAGPGKPGPGKPGPGKPGGFKGGPRKAGPGGGAGGGQGGGPRRGPNGGNAPPRRRG